MSDQDKLGLFIACMSIGLALIIFFSRDFLWEIELFHRKASGRSLERTPEWDRLIDIIAWIAVAYAVLVLLYVAID